MHRLSDTCWNARIDAIKPLIKRPREELTSLPQLQEHLDLPAANVSNEVDSLINWMQTFKFVLMATIWFKLLQNHYYVIYINIYIYIYIYILYGCMYRYILYYTHVNNHFRSHT